MNQQTDPSVPATAAGHAAPRPSRRFAARILIALLTLGTGLALIGAGRYFWLGIEGRFTHLREAVDQVAARQQALARQIEQTGRTLAEQQRQLQEQDALVRRESAAITTRQQALAETETRLTQQEEALHQTLAQLHRDVGRSGQEWRAAAAAYLVEVAQQRLALEGDRVSAIKALEAAEVRLGETGDPRWLPVRGRLAADLEGLRRVPEADRPALSRELADMAAGIERLPLPPAHAWHHPSGDAAAGRGGGERSLNSLLQDGLAGLKSLVQVRHSDQPQALAAGPERPQALLQGLRLRLDSARFALLRRDQALYDAELATAGQWLKDFFDPQRPEVRLYLEDIARLRAAPIAPPLPDLTPTLEALRRLLDPEAPPS